MKTKGVSQLTRWLLLFLIIPTIALAVVMVFNTSGVSASPGQTSNCTSCHTYPSSQLKITTSITTTTVKTSQSFTVTVNWTGGTSGRRNEISWPSVVNNSLFSPTPRVPYSGTALSGSTTSTLTAPATPGTYTVRVYGAKGTPRETDYKNITVTVVANAAPVLAAIGNKSVLAGQPLQFTVSATDANNDPLTYSASGLPAGATFNAATRTFSWTPSTAGTYSNVRFQVSDGVVVDFENITITVTAANVAPVLAAIGNKSVSAGQLLQFTVSATDANNDPLTYSASGLPAGATFNAATRTFAWTPSTAGTYSNVHFEVTDGQAVAFENIAITVTAANVAPVLSPIGNKSVSAGQLLQFNVSATDANNDPLTYSASGLPAGATFNAATRTFSWTPASAGTYSNVHFEVSDGSLVDFENIAITVTAANVAPVLAAIGSKSIVAGQLLQFTVSATDANNDPLTYSASGLPAGATFNVATRTFAWTPASTGTYSNVHFEVTDGQAVASENITITVTAANVAPVLAAIGNKSVSAGQLLQFTISATDANNDPLTYSASGLPAGASFNAATRTFSWTPASAGTYSNVHFEVTDGAVADFENITITVTLSNMAPVLDPIGNKIGVVYELLQFTVSATDANGDTLTYSASNLPSGATFNPSTRTFSWTPNSNQDNNYTNIRFEVSDGQLTDFETISISVDDSPNNVAPVLGAIGNKSVIAGLSLQFTISATDGNNDPLTYSASGLPAGASFNTSTRTFSWTPTSAQTGTYTGVRFVVSDGRLTDSENITITVAAPNVAPVMASIGNKSVVAGQLLQFTVSATDANNDTLTYSASNLPAGATFTSATRTFAWTPTSAQVGTYPNIYFEVFDGQANVYENITITVAVPNSAPVLSPVGNKSVVAGQLLQFTVSASDPNGDTLTYSASNLPAGATFNAATRTFSWTPTSGQTGSYSNTHFEVSDGQLPASENITITVTAPNAAPVLSTIGDKSVTAGQLLQFTISASDPNNDTLTYSASNLPAGATFNAATRTFSWTPTAAGTYPGVHFEVSDGQLTAFENITITVTAANAAPVLNAIGDKSVTAGQLLEFTISASDPNNDTLTYSASNLPAGATFNAATATFSWTPTLGQVGDYPGVHFEVSDGQLTAAEDITITVNSTTVNLPPVLNPIGSQSVRVGQFLQITLSATDPNNDTLTYSASNLPSGASFNAATRTFSWTPSQAGSYSNVHFEVSDGQLTDFENISIDVTNSNAPPSLEPVGNKLVTVGQLLRFTIYATDPNGDAITYSASNLPPGATFTASTRTFSWTPTASQAGTYTGVRFEAFDGSQSAVASITITVDGPPVLGAIGNKSATIGQALQFTLSATDPNNDPLVYHASNLPPGATFTASTLTFSWTPAPGQTGTYRNVHFEVSDGATAVSEDITITITAGASNAPPVISPIGNKSVLVGKLLQFSVAATDADSDPLVYSASNLPAGASFNAATRTFSWTPGQGQVGIYQNIRFEVTDGSLTASEIITITVDKPDKIPPTINGVTASAATTTTVVISWITDKPSTTQVEYWGSPRQRTPLDETFVTNHRVTLTGLIPGSAYRYRVISQDKSGNTSQSLEFSFATQRAFSVSNLLITPEIARTGEPIDISVLVTNQSDTAGTFEVVLKIGNALEATKNVDLAPREQRTVTFTTTRYATGVFQVDVNGVSGSLAVPKPTPATGGFTFQGILLGLALGLVGTAGGAAVYLWRRRS